jgi:palmitoyltransferase ZDHHC13/17
VYIVHLLIQYGGDPLLTDSQGYNTLHLATHSSNIMLILYLLHQPLITPDLIDPQDHTPMMWAAFQGDALSVDVLLRWGADVKKHDKAGLTSLHWAVVRGTLYPKSLF